MAVLHCAVCSSHLGHMGLVHPLHALLGDGNWRAESFAATPAVWKSALEQYKAKQFWLGVFGIWRRACRRGTSFLLLHPKLGGHGGQAQSRLSLGPTAWTGPWPILLGQEDAANQPSRPCSY